jgi:hypothetical protein
MDLRVPEHLHDDPGQAIHRDSSGPGSSEVFLACGKEREEVVGDVPEDADDAAGRQGCFRAVEFGRERHP